MRGADSPARAAEEDSHAEERARDGQPYLSSFVHSPRPPRGRDNACPKEATQLRQDTGQPLMTCLDKISFLHALDPLLFLLPLAHTPPLSLFLSSHPVLRSFLLIPAARHSTSPSPPPPLNTVSMDFCAMLGDKGECDTKPMVELQWYHVAIASVLIIVNGTHSITAART